MSHLQVLRMDEGHREQWNNFVAQMPHFALMQGYEWGEFKEKLGWKAVRLAVERGGEIVALAQLLIKRVPWGLFSVGYVPRGPLVDWEDQATTATLLDALHREARRHRAVFTKIEPPLVNSDKAHRRLQACGFQASLYSNQPRATIIVDLTPDLDGVLGEMRKQMRRDVRRSARNGVTVRKGNRQDLPAFFDLMQITSQRGGFSPRARNYYEQEWQIFSDNGQAVLLMAFYQGELLAVQMAFCCGKHAAAFHGGSSGEHAKLCPNHLLVWEAIKWAKARGCHTYDLWGIPDEVGEAVYEGKDPPGSDRTDGLWGVYRFKSGFSKDVRFYVGAYDYVYSAPLYRLIANRLLNQNLLDRIAVWMDAHKRA